MAYSRKRCWTALQYRLCCSRTHVRPEKDSTWVSDHVIGIGLILGKWWIWGKYTFGGIHFLCAVAFLLWMVDLTKIYLDMHLVSIHKNDQQLLFLQRAADVQWFLLYARLCQWAEEITPWRVLACLEAGKPSHLRNKQMGKTLDSGCAILAVVRASHFSPTSVWCCGSVAQSCPPLCDPMNSSTPGLFVLHSLPEFAQIRVHWVGDAIRPSHPLSSTSPSAFSLSQQQGLFQWVGSLHQVPKGLELQLQRQSFQWIFRVDFL